MSPTFLVAAATLGPASSSSEEEEGTASAGLLRVVPAFRLAAATLGAAASSSSEEEGATAGAGPPIASLMAAALALPWALAKMADDPEEEDDDGDAAAAGPLSNQAALASE